MRDLNNTIITENDVLAFYMPRIKQICKGKWPNLEQEDRESEAAFYFICAIRSFPINDGHFWKDYCEALIPYMDNLNRLTSSRYFKKESSLDCPIYTNNVESDITLFDILEGPGLDETSLAVESFIGTLSMENQNIIRGLMEKVPRSVVARRYHLSLYTLQKRLKEIEVSYSKW